MDEDNWDLRRLVFANILKNNGHLGKIREQQYLCWAEYVLLVAMKEIVRIVLGGRRRFKLENQVTKRERTLIEIKRKLQKTVYGALNVLHSALIEFTGAH